MKPFWVGVVCLSLCMTTQSYANDSVGYIATGGVEYIKNDKITMHTEDLSISKIKLKLSTSFVI